MSRLQSPRDQVIAANVEFYKRTTTGEYDYEHYEYCVSDPFVQRMLEEDLDAIAAGLADKSERIRCLDCGGGSGHLTLRMLRRGWDVTVVDVSPDMLAAAEARLGVAGYRPRLINDSIENFLCTNDDNFEVVMFSSVLHHLYDPLGVIQEVARRIMPGGFFYSNFDMPRPRSRLVTKCLSDLDILCAKLFLNRKDFPSGRYPASSKGFCTQGFDS